MMGAAALVWERRREAALDADAASLRRTVFWTFVGNAVYRACQWGMLIAITKLSTPENAGRFALAFALTVPVFTFANTPARGLLATDAAGDFTLRTYLALRLITTALAVAGLSAVALLGPFDRETMLVVLALTAAKAFESMSDMHHGALQRVEQTGRIAASLALKGLLGLAGLGAAIHLTGSLSAGTAALAVAWGAVWLAVDRPFTRHMRAAAAPARGALGDAWRLALLTVPMAIVTLLLAVKFSAPRLIVGHYLGEAELGVFAAMAYATLAFEMLVGSMAQGAAPRLAAHHHRGEVAQFRRVLLGLVLIAAAVGVVSVVVVSLAGGPLLAALYRPEFAMHPAAFVTLVAASSVGLVTSILGYTATATRCLREQVWVSAAVLAVSAGAGVLLVPHSGIEGVAAAELLAALVHAAGLAWIVARIVHRLRDVRTA